MHVSRYDRRFHAAGIGVLVIVLTGWLVVYMIAVTRQGTWANEAGYIIKSWWYVSGRGEALHR